MRDAGAIRPAPGGAATEALIVRCDADRGREPPLAAGATARRFARPWPGVQPRRAVTARDVGDHARPVAKLPRQAAGAIAIRHARSSGEGAVLSLTAVFAI